MSLRSDWWLEPVWSRGELRKCLKDRKYAFLVTKAILKPQGQKNALLIFSSNNLNLYYGSNQKLLRITYAYFIDLR